MALKEEDTDLSQALCLPVSVPEILQANQLPQVSYVQVTVSSLIQECFVSLATFNVIILGFTFRMGFVSLWWIVGLRSSIIQATCPQPFIWTLTW